MSNLSLELPERVGISSEGVGRDRSGPSAERSRCSNLTSSTYASKGFTAGTAGDGQDIEFSDSRAVLLRSWALRSSRGEARWRAPRCGRQISFPRLLLLSLRFTAWPAGSPNLSCCRAVRTSAAGEFPQFRRSSRSHRRRFAREHLVPRTPRTSSLRRLQRLRRRSRSRSTPTPCEAVRMRGS